MAKKVQSGLKIIVFQNFILSHKDNNEDVGVQRIFISPQGKTQSGKYVSRALPFDLIPAMQDNGLAGK